ncbi:hypothetical protein ACLOJK_038142 [Asimina triloba]
MHYAQLMLTQAEEAQRLRKKRKAENMRLDMERRQQLRLQEVRESQKKDVETINLKEQLRIEVRKELEKLQLEYRDMASLLRALGILVEGGLYPLPHEVNAAYKRALLRFHPDRASRCDIRQQVEAEEKFKLISHLKDKLMPKAHVVALEKNLKKKRLSKCFGARASPKHSIAFTWPTTFLGLHLFAFVPVTNAAKVQN